MKKLISVFAALALVGSLAAQKKPAAKAPAKPAAPAAPAVAAPAAPAIAAPAAAPAPAGSAAGMGLFVEGRGTFTLGNGTSDSRQDGDTTGTTSTYKLANTSGFGGGATIGYDIASNLALVGSFDYRAISSRKWEQKAATTTTTIQQKTNTMVLGLGLRPSVSAFGGTFYAGAGVAYVLPFDTVSTIETKVNSTGTLTSGAGTNATNSASREVTQSWNGGIGGYGELGYQYSISSNLFIGLGARLLVATVNNADKNTVSKDLSTSNFASVTTVGKESVDTTATPTQTGFASNGVTDIAAALTVGFRF